MGVSLPISIGQPPPHASTQRLHLDLTLESSQPRNILRSLTHDSKKRICPQVQPMDVSSNPSTHTAPTDLALRPALPGLHLGRGGSEVLPGPDQSSRGPCEASRPFGEIQSHREAKSKPAEDCSKTPTYLPTLPERDGELVKAIPVSSIGLIKVKARMRASRECGGPSFGLQRGGPRMEASGGWPQPGILSVCVVASSRQPAPADPPGPE